MSEHFAACTVVHFEDEGSRRLYTGTMDMKIGTRLYECTVCEWLFTLKYFVQLHLTEKHNITLTNSLTLNLPMEFISMSPLIEERTDNLNLNLQS